MLKITGYIVFIGNSISILILLYIFIELFIEHFIDNKLNLSGEEIPILLLIIILCLSGIYYSVRTMFWVNKPNIIKDLDKENEIIKRKIEKAELLRKLKNYEDSE